MLFYAKSSTLSNEFLRHFKQLLSKYVEFNVEISCRFGQKYDPYKNQEISICYEMTQYISLRLQ